ncbi:MAG: FkbM family methyltransferase [Terriglobia bacterium]
MEVLRRLAHVPNLRRLARRLRISGILKKAYFHCAGPSGGVLSVSLHGTVVRFSASTPTELYDLEENLRDEVLPSCTFMDALAATLRCGDTFYDIGSHIGQFVLPMAKVVGEEGSVIAFEPESAAYARLVLHLGLNGLSNVRVFRKALGDKNFLAQLVATGFSCPFLLPHGTQPESHLTRETVEVVRGDWLVSTEALPIPRAVKIDVEGYEYFVLRGLERTLAHPACELLCCEMHPLLLPPEVSPEKIIGLVESLGFNRIRSRPRRAEIHLIAEKVQAQS